MATIQRQINVTKQTNGHYAAEFLGLWGDQTGDLAGAMTSLVAKLFATRKQLSELPATFITPQASEVLKGLNEFLPTRSRSTNWE